jgi:hypothetical protein
MTSGTRRTIPSRSGRIEKTPRGRRLLDDGHVAQQSRERHEKGTSVGSLDGKSRLQGGFGLRSRRRPCRACLADHHARAPDGLRENLIVTRQVAQLVARVLVEIAEARRGNAGRHPVGLGENDVEADRHHAKLGEPRDKVRKDGARPRPLPDLLEARFVDVDDDHGPRHRLPRTQPLEKVEGSQPDFLERRRIEDAQRNEREQQQNADRACQTEASRPTSQRAHDLKTHVGEMESTGRRSAPLSRLRRGVEGGGEVNRSRAFSLPVPPYKRGEARCRAAVVT